MTHACLANERYDCASRTLALPPCRTCFGPEARAVLDERNVPEFVGKVDEKLDIDEAREAAQHFADMFGHVVTLEVTDEDEEELDAESFRPEHDNEIDF